MLGRRSLGRTDCVGRRSRGPRARHIVRVLERPPRRQRELPPLKPRKFLWTDLRDLGHEGDVLARFSSSSTLVIVVYLARKAMRDLRAPRLTDGQRLSR